MFLVFTVIRNQFSDTNDAQQFSCTRVWNIQQHEYLVQKLFQKCLFYFKKKHKVQSGNIVFRKELDTVYRFSKDCWKYFDQVFQKMNVLQIELWLNYKFTPELCILCLLSFFNEHLVQILKRPTPTLKD